MDTVLWLCPSLPTDILKWLSLLPILMQESFWWWQCSDRYIISLFSHLHTPFPPFSPSLISRTVSVDVKHRVYLLYILKYRLSKFKKMGLIRQGRVKVGYVTVLHEMFFSAFRFNCYGSTMFSRDNCVRCNSRELSVVVKKIKCFSWKNKQTKTKLNYFEMFFTKRMTILIIRICVR